MLIEESRKNCLNIETIYVLYIDIWYGMRHYHFVCLNYIHDIFHAYRLQYDLVFDDAYVSIVLIRSVYFEETICRLYNIDTILMLEVVTIYCLF